jgi:hypothetical protein
LSTAPMITRSCTHLSRDPEANTLILSTARGQTLHLLSEGLASLSSPWLSLHTPNRVPLRAMDTNEVREDQHSTLHHQYCSNKKSTYPLSQVASLSNEIKAVNEAIVNWECMLKLDLVTTQTSQVTSQIAECKEKLKQLVQDLQHEAGRTSSIVNGKECWILLPH